MCSARSLSQLLRHATLVMDKTLLSSSAIFCTSVYNTTPESRGSYSAGSSNMLPHGLSPRKMTAKQVTEAMVYFDPSLSVTYRITDTTVDTMNRNTT